jgi:hypothetical protein
VQQPQRSEDDDGDTYKRWKTINNGSPILTGNLRLELVRALNGRGRIQAMDRPPHRAGGVDGRSCAATRHATTSIHYKGSLVRCAST